jgi:hypothetical protein
MSIKQDINNETLLDIKDRLESIKKDLEDPNGLTFDGEPLYQDSINSLIEAMKIGLSLAKLKQRKSLLEKDVK